MQTVDQIENAENAEEAKDTVPFQETNDENTEERQGGY